MKLVLGVGAPWNGMFLHQLIVRAVTVTTRVALGAPSHLLLIQLLLKLLSILTAGQVLVHGAERASAKRSIVTPRIVLWLVEGWCLLLILLYHIWHDTERSMIIIDQAHTTMLVHTQHARRTAERGIVAHALLDTSATAHSWKSLPSFNLVSQILPLLPLDQTLHLVTILLYVVCFLAEN